MIVTVTPNPSIDRTASLPSPLTRGAVHRVTSVTDQAGGKGVNVARALTLAGLDALDQGQSVMLKLTLPSTDNLYRELVDHPKVVRVVALSGGYDRDEACDKLAANHGVIASFSRALTEGLTAQQSDEQFNATLDAAITAIAKASAT